VKLAASQEGLNFMELRVKPSAAALTMLKLRDPLPENVTGS
jgi:hypothetical protein